MSNRVDNSYIGFEAWWNSLLMSAKMATTVFVLALFAHLLLFLAALALFYKEELYWITRYFVAVLKAPLNGKMEVVQDGQILVLSAEEFIRQLKPYYFDYVGKVSSLFFSLGVVYPAAFTGSYLYFRKRTRKETSDTFLRGSSLVPDKKLNKLMEKNREVCSLPIGRTRQPKKREPEHTAVFGRSGAGKTQIISGMVSKIRKRGGKAVLYSYKADDYFKSFFDETKDLLFNPVDKRCVGWNLFNEIRSLLDIDAIAASMIPLPPNVKEPFFYNNAREVFRTILVYLYKNNQRNNVHIWKTLTLETEQLAELLSTTEGCEAGYKHIADAKSKTTENIISTLIEHTTCFRFLADIEGDFSTREWMRSGTGFLHITNLPEAEETIKPALTLFIDLLIRNLLSLPNSSERRIHFVLDELGTLKKLESIHKLIVLTRSKGGCAILGAQDVGKLDDVYGSNFRKSLLNSCGTSVILSCKDPDTAEYLSKMIADREVKEKRGNLSYGPSAFRDGGSISEQVQTRRLVLPAEIMDLPNLTAYVKYPGYPWTITKAEYKGYPSEVEPLLLRDFILL